MEQELGGQNKGVPNTTGRLSGWAGAGWGQIGWDVRVHELCDSTDPGSNPSPTSREK